MNGKLANQKRRDLLRAEKVAQYRLAGPNKVRAVIGFPVRTLRNNTVAVFKNELLGKFGFASAIGGKWNMPKNFTFRTAEAAAAAALGLRIVNTL